MGHLLSRRLGIVNVWACDTCRLITAIARIVNWQSIKRFFIVVLHLDPQTSSDRGKINPMSPTTRSPSLYVGMSGHVLKFNHVGLTTSFNRLHQYTRKKD